MSSTRRALGFTVLAAVAGFGLLAPRPAVDNSIGALLSDDGPATRDYQRFQGLFGTDELLLVRLSGDDLPAVLTQARQMQSILRDSDAIEHVIGPHSAYADLCEALEDPIARELVDAEELKHSLSGPLGKVLPLLTVDPPTAVVLGFGPTSPIEVRAALLERLKAQQSDAQAAGLTVMMAGPPLLNLYLDTAGRDVERTALPLLLLISVGLLLLLTRSARVSLVLLAPVGLAVLSSDAVLGLSGGTANVMVNVVKPLLFVLLLAAGLHIAVRFFAHRRAGLDPHEAAWAAARDKQSATTLALFTTAIGFGSLALSDVAPIRTFGLLSAAGLAIGLPLTLLTLPTLLALIARGAPPKEHAGFDGFARRLVQLGLQNPRAAVGSGLLVLVLGALALPQLKSDPHAIRYFEADHPLRADYQALESAGLGLSSVELVLTATAPWSLSAAQLAPVETLRQHAAAQPGVRAALGLPLLLREATHQIRHDDRLPDVLFAQQAIKARPGEARLMLSRDGKSLRLSLLTETLDADALDRLQSKLQSSASQLMPNVQVVFTGSYQLLLRAQRSLLSTLRNSLITTLILMELVLLIFVRRFSVALVALIPNLAPVALTFIVMAVLGIPVDLGTSMTAAVALGIAVDDTLHVVVSWPKGPPDQLAARTGRAIVLSSIVIGLGFLALTTSGFGPTRNFGLLAGLAMLTALWGDLVILPALLMRVRAR